MADRKVKTSIKVRGTWYYTGSTMPAEVADTVTNTRVFEDLPAPAPAEVVPETPKPAKKAAPKKAQPPA